MAQEEFKRKLAAILSADAAEYSRLMREDEEATIRTISAYRQVISSQVKQHKGRVVDSPGDNVLAEFASVVDAVRSAVRIQKEIAQRNTNLAQGRRMFFRIGVNLGDIVEEGDRIYGDGVNIAARLEGLAESGGICISRTAFDQLKGKLEVGYQYLGEHSVKNLKEPVRVYKILMEPQAAGKVIGEKKVKRSMVFAAALALLMGVGGLAGWYLYLQQYRQVEPASLDRMAYPLPDKPSIAVLPFDNLSRNPDQEYIADGFSENIITALSNNPYLFVIARNSTFTYKGKAVKVQQVSEDLGVRYVLEGSIQKSGDRLRVSVQLIDALNGYHLWANRYDRRMQDLFVIQDEITKEIAIALSVELTSGEQARVWHKTANIEAWGYCTRASAYFTRFSREGNAKAQEMFAEAVKLDPGYAFAWTMLAWTHLMEVWLGYSSSPAGSLKNAFELARKAAHIDQNHPEIHMLFANLYETQKKFDQALVEGEKAIALGPNNAEDHYLFSRILFRTGRPEEAIVMAQKAIRLHPYYPARYLAALATSYFAAGRYGEAMAKYEDFLKRDDKDPLWTSWAHLFMTSACVRLGKDKQAGSHAGEALKLNPRASIESLREYFRGFKYPETMAPVLDDLRKAGIPEKSPTSPVP
ncbi:MAG: tetratricopeptide repeat protein [Desulfobacterales bacterium]|nr:MAG: tetratricopeptide repeat protein [Desulfobacterales bacterium]